MTRKGGRALLALGLASALIAGAGAVVAGAPPRVVAGAPTRTAAKRQVVVQVLHRAARAPSGALLADAAGRAADAAAAALAGRGAALEAWAVLFGQGRSVTIVAAPQEGELAAAVAERLRILAGDERRVRIVGDDAAPRGRFVVVAAPDWKDGAPTIDLRRRRGAALVLVDLFEPRIDGAPWRADEVLAARDAGAADAALRAVLARRAGTAAAGEIAGASALAWRRVGIE
ncbi:hypothetical protein LLG88_05790 [bacterium]|nr:hypothetical protein [bacterium]